jgi:SAM-dependent methyltransferase
VARDLAETVAWHAAGEGPPLKLMHTEAVALDGCASCGTIWRRDPGLWRSAVAAYSEDRYDADLLARLHHEDVARLGDDDAWLTAHGVTAGARLLEVACYVGGFLAVAAARGAMAVGLDPNPQMVAWCRQHRFDARVGVIEDADYPPDSFDGVWILNCFDQLPDPHAVLAAARRVLRPGGRLVIRTPNAAFIRAAYDASAGGTARRIAVEQALWGVPYLCCYTLPALARLVGEHGFTVAAVRARPDGGSASPPVPEVPPWFDLAATAVDVEPHVSGSGAWSHDGRSSGSTLVTHLTHQGPRRPGTTRRTGAPWPARSGSPP